MGDAGGVYMTSDIAWTLFAIISLGAVLSLLWRKR